MVTLLAIACPSTVCAQEGAAAWQAQQPVQTDFGIEVPIQHPVPIPESALRALRDDSYVQECVAQHPEVQDIQPWFAASAIDLNADGRLDLVVQASDAAPGCLMGANIGPFWILENLGQSYREVLRAHELGISVLRTRTRGFFDIKGGKATAIDALTTIYKFDGAKYRAGSTRRHRI